MSRQKSEGFYSLDIGIPNLEEKNIRIELMGEKIPLDQSGMENVKIQDRCGATAYHIPQGSLIIYNPEKKSASIQTISTTEIAPSLLKNFNVKVPEYMRKAMVL